MIRNLFILAVILIPFTGLPGLSFLGEIRHEASAYVFILTLALAIGASLQAGHARGLMRERVTALPQIMYIVLAVIFLSFTANFSAIRDSYFQGRWGMEKFVSSTLLVLYGFSLAFLTYYLAGRHKWDSLTIKPMMISVTLCVIFSFFEQASHYGVGLSGVYDSLSSVVHGGFKRLVWDTRLRSVAFEPPDFANTAGYIWPWLVGGIMATRGGRRTFLVTLWMLLNIMIVMSEARTSLVVISGLALVFVVLRVLFLPPIPQRDPEHFVPVVTILFGVVLPTAFVGIGLFFDRIVMGVVSGDSISNLSRLASMVAAFNMFGENPFFGIGFGQFGFHAADFMPSWGFLSWEIQHWLFEPSGFWPAVYSVYARFAADMGILGPLMWVGIWLWLAYAVLVETLLYRKATGEIPFAAFPLIMSCACVLLAGVPCDSVRTPMIWINMGLACRYLHEMRAFRRDRAAALSLATA